MAQHYYLLGSHHDACYFFDKYKIKLSNAWHILHQRALHNGPGHLELQTVLYLLANKC